MTKLYIQITDQENGSVDVVHTNGAVLLYLEENKIKVLGKIDIAELAPLITKIALEKLIK